MASPDEQRDERSRDFKRRPVSHQATIFLILTLLVAGAAFWFAKSFVGVGPAWDQGPLPQVQTHWQLAIPVDTTDVRHSGVEWGEQGTSSWVLDYAAGSVEELRRASTGPGIGAPVNAPLTDCDAVEIYLEATALDCAADLQGRQTTHARQDGDALWVVWDQQRITIITFTG